MMETDNSGSPVPKKEDEEIVDLLNEITRNLETEPDGDLIELLEEVPASEITAEDILALSGDSVPQPIQHAKDLVQDGFELGEALDLAIDNQLVVTHDLVSPLGPGMDAPFEKARPGHSDSGVPSVSSEQLEAAIERVIDRMLWGKMDHLLATAVENAVTREISRLKRLLSDLT